ncbi:hypothetical protein [Bradyrhizobium sp. SBR1B]|uniref:hypothetical protein n=1 Tax=Bradyrhizobium sp. SBR1B TaxID=2663836 RepID=UPI001605DF89|nr:hypothetical protein [Bradyrhizobium sp. SBR1B]MBB4379982.1 hypothetical protein [Bradyrhizobium sp. SBR1B]
MSGRGYTPAAITEISKLRQRIQGRSREKVDHSTFKQISSKKVVDLWAKEGTRPGLSESKTPQERLRRIDQILALMKNSSFEIAFVDGETARHLGWNEEEAGNEFSFVVQGDDAIVVEMSVASIARDGDRFADIYGIIRDEVVVARMRKDFEKVWEMLPAFVKDRENTMRYLQSLRTIIQQEKA